MENEQKERINLWSEEEEAILREYYPTEGAAVAARLPDRNKTAIRRHARAMGLRKRLPNGWTPEEDAILREFFLAEGEAVSARLPGRTAQACRARANRFGIMSRNVPWSKEEDNILRKYYPTEGSGALERLPGRSTAAFRQRVRLLQIKNIKRKPSQWSWTKKEEAILRKYYPTEGMDVAARLSGRSKRACRSHAQILHIKQTVRHTNSNAWTDEENEILKQYYPEEGKNVVNRLNGRSVTACQKQVSRLKEEGKWIPATSAEN